MWIEMINKLKLLKGWLVGKFSVESFRCFRYFVFVEVLVVRLIGGVASCQRKLNKWIGSESTGGGEGSGDGENEPVDLVPRPPVSSEVSDLSSAPLPSEGDRDDDGDGSDPDDPIIPPFAGSAVLPVPSGKEKDEDGRDVPPVL